MAAVRIFNGISRDLDLWPFDLEQLTYMAGHVTNLATKFEHPMPIRSWFMSYNVSIENVYAAIAHAPNHVTITYLESPTPICLFTMQLLFGYEDD